MNAVGIFAGAENSGDGKYGQWQRQLCLIVNVREFVIILIVILAKKEMFNGQKVIERKDESRLRQN